MKKFRKVFMRQIPLIPQQSITIYKIKIIFSLKLYKLKIRMTRKRKRHDIYETDIDTIEQVFYELIEDDNRTIDEITTTMYSHFESDSDYSSFIDYALRRYIEQRTENADLLKERRKINAQLKKLKTQNTVLEGSIKGLQSSNKMLLEHSDTLKQNIAQNGMTNV